MPPCVVETARRYSALATFGKFAQEGWQAGGFAHEPQGLVGAAPAFGELAAAQETARGVDFRLRSSTPSASSRRPASRSRENRLDSSRGSPGAISSACSATAEPAQHIAPLARFEVPAVGDPIFEH